MEKNLRLMGIVIGFLGLLGGIFSAGAYFSNVKEIPGVLKSVERHTLEIALLGQDIKYIKEGVSKLLEKGVLK